MESWARVGPNRGLAPLSGSTLNLISLEAWLGRRAFQRTMVLDYLQSFEHNVNLVVATKMQTSGPLSGVCP